MTGFVVQGHIYTVYIHIYTHTHTHSGVQKFGISKIFNFDFLMFFLTPCLHRAQQLKSVYTGLGKVTVKNHLNFVSVYVINRTRHQFTVGDLSCCAASSVDGITDYNGFYCSLLRRAARVWCRHGVMLIKAAFIWSKIQEKKYTVFLMPEIHRNTLA